MMGTSLANKKTWNGFLAVISMLLAALLAVMLFGPRPTERRSPGERARDEAALLSQTHAADQKTAQARARAAAFLWSEAPDSISPQALSIVTEAAKKCDLKISAFRPQKPAEVPGLQQLAYLVAVEGRFPNVASFLRTVETSGNRLAVNLFQVTSADGATDAVTATVGLVAFREPTQGSSER